MTQPEALRLAGELDPMGGVESEAAAELRRLHFAHEHQHAMAGEMLRQAERAQRLNAELLEALKLADAMLSGANMNANVVEKKVRAAIAKAEEV